VNGLEPGFGAPAGEFGLALIAILQKSAAEGAGHRSTLYRGSRSKIQSVSP
jgi:hypothetical protein